MGIKWNLPSGKVSVMHLHQKNFQKLKSFMMR